MKALLAALFLMFLLALLLADVAVPARAQTKHARKTAAAVQKNIRIPQQGDSRVTAAILERKVLVGMTAAEVLTSWGRPDREYRTELGSGWHEQWIYESLGHKPVLFLEAGKRRADRDNYLYFENGTLVAVQN